MKKKMTVLCGLLMAVLVTAYSVSGTYAKYTSSMDTTDTARVARWSINVGEKDSLGLFKLAYGANNEIESSTEEFVVAPGASGEVDIVIGGSAEVASKLDIIIDTDKSQNNVRYSNDISPIKFSIDGSTWFEYEQLGTNLKNALKDADGEDIVYAANTTINKTVTLHWAWAYDKDALDKMNGITATAGWEAAKYDVEDTKLGTKYQSAPKTDEDAFKKVIAKNEEWKNFTYENLDSYAAANTIRDLMKQELKNGEPNITIVLKVTATQVAPTTATEVTP